MDDSTYLRQKAFGFNEYAQGFLYIAVVMMRSTSISLNICLMTSTIPIPDIPFFRRIPKLRADLFLSDSTRIYLPNCVIIVN